MNQLHKRIPRDKEAVTGRLATIRASLSPLAVEPDLFESEEQYEQVVQNVAARIRSGQILPCEPDPEP